jgi:hypothetical protein
LGHSPHLTRGLRSPRPRSLPHPSLKLRWGFLGLFVGLVIFGGLQSADVSDS